MARLLKCATSGSKLEGDQSRLFAMPRTIPQSELDAICAAASSFSEGASVDDISGALRFDIPRRTLQRRLALLVEEGRLISDGAGRGCRYFSPEHVRRKGAVNREDALAVLRRLKPELAKQYGVTRLALFGSTVRNASKPDSDVDVVVEFDGPATSRRFFGVQFRLEDEFGRPVDLVSEKALRNELRPYIEQEAVDA